MESSLSRTSSSASFSSSEETLNANAINTAISTRRTRKRFTNTQLTMLESLFHQNSHPSRPEREGVAKAGGMEVKSVTIWFQNKRQTERKASNNALSNNKGPTTVSSSSYPSSRSNSISSTSSRPSLDRVASRSELRAHVPRTPMRRHNPSGAIWDNMPSSPLAEPNSPPPREYVEFAKNQKTRRTLEWACAAARVADKDKDGVSTRSKGRDREREKFRDRRKHVDNDITDEEMDEAITPPSTWAKEDPRWSHISDGGVIRLPQMGSYPKGVDDDDMMKAALALCGLGRR